MTLINIAKFKLLLRSLHNFHKKQQLLSNTLSTMGLLALGDTLTQYIEFKLANANRIKIDISNSDNNNNNNNSNFSLDKSTKLDQPDAVKNENDNSFAKSYELNRNGNFFDFLQ